MIYLLITFFQFSIKYFKKLNRKILIQNARIKIFSWRVSKKIVYENRKWEFIEQKYIHIRVIREYTILSGHTHLKGKKKRSIQFKQYYLVSQESFCEKKIVSFYLQITDENGVKIFKKILNTCHLPRKTLPGSLNIFFNISSVNLNKIGQVVPEKSWLPQEALLKMASSKNYTTPPFFDIFNSKLYGSFFNRHYQQPANKIVNIFIPLGRKKY